MTEVAPFKCRLFGIKFNDSKTRAEAEAFLYQNLNGSLSDIIIKQILPDPSPTSTSQYIHEIILRFMVDDKLTNFNILCTKLNQASVTNLSIFDGEKQQAMKKEIHIKKILGPTKLDMEVKSVIDLPNKLLTTTPDTKVLCKVTNALAPNEIWVQDVLDADNMYNQFEIELSKKYTQIWEENDCGVTRNRWQVGDLCVILKSMKAGKEKVFYRARLTQKINEDTFKALYLDLGVYVENVEAVHIFKLIEQFKVCYFCDF